MIAITFWSFSATACRRAGGLSDNVRGRACHETDLGRRNEGEEETETLNSREFLQSVHRDDSQPLGVRMRCAVEALQYERPKLTAVGSAVLDEQTLVICWIKPLRGVERAKRPPPKMIDVTPHPAEELKGPMARMKRTV